MSPRTSRASSNGLRELSREQGWALCLAFYVHNVMMNRWDTNAAASPTSPPTLHVNRIWRGGAPYTSLHPEVTPAQLMTTSCPEATKNKENQTSRHQSWLYCFLLPFVRDTAYTGFFFAFKVQDMKSNQSDWMLRVDKG